MDTSPVVVGGVVALALVVAVVVLGRVLAQRAELGTRLELVGDVPEVGTWLPPALQAASAQRPWAYELYPILTAGPWETRAEMLSPTGSGLVVVRVDSPQPSGTFFANDPVRVTVTAREVTPPSGLVATLFGAALTPVGRMRSRVARQIRRQTGAAPGLSHRPVGNGPRGRRQLVLAGVIAAVVIAGAVVAVRALPELGQALGGNRSASPSQKPSATKAARPTKPKGAKTACAVERQLKSRPGYSAVNAKARCGFAENVRAAYVKKKADGQKIKLTKVSDPKTKKTYSVTCAGAKPVVCQGGADKSGVVYLYG